MKHGGKTHGSDCGCKTCCRWKKEKGGMMQGYNDRLDESLGMRDGVEPMMMQSYKDRRDESKGMEKAMGRRAYQSVGTMDKMGMGGYLLAGGTGAYLGAKYPDKVKKVTDPLDKAVEDINRNLRNRYEDGGVVVWLNSTKR